MAVPWPTVRRLNIKQNTKYKQLSQGMQSFNITASDIKFMRAICLRHKNAVYTPPGDFVDDSEGEEIDIKRQFKYTNRAGVELYISLFTNQDVTVQGPLGVRLELNFTTLDELEELVGAYKQCRACFIKYIQCCAEGPGCCNIAMCDDCELFAEEKKERCSICLDDQPAPWGVCLPCGHEFHKGCFLQIRPKQMEGGIYRACPLCRGCVKDFKYETCIRLI